LAVWTEDIGRSQDAPPGKILDAFLEETNFLFAVKKFAPGLLDEVKGMSEGSGTDYKTLYAFQLWDEFWWYVRNKKAGLLRPEHHHCTIGGAFNQRGLPPLLGTNMDLPGWTDGFGVLLHIRHQAGPDPRLTRAGACGLNSRAVDERQHRPPAQLPPGRAACTDIVRACSKSRTT
jgi:hypothetical protein